MDRLFENPDCIVEKNEALFSLRDENSGANNKKKAGAKRFRNKALDSEIRIINRKNQTYQVICIDVHPCCNGKGLMGKKQKKCDFAVVSGINAKAKQIVLVELKGSDWEHAVKQIESTLEWLYQDNGRERKPTKAKIILKKFSAIPFSQHKFRQIKLKWSCDLSLERSPYDLKIS